MSDIPKAREIVELVANLLVDSQEERLVTLGRDLEEALGLMRRPSLNDRRMTRVRNRGLNAEQVARIRELAATTDFSQMQIADMTGTNPGRVSEVINGQRDDNGNLISEAHFTN